MSATVQQIYAANPSTVIANGDLVYIVKSPYTPGSDSAIIGSDLKAMFLQPINNLSELTSPAVARNNLGLSIIATATPPLSPILGGTGVNNGANTITLGGNILTANSFTTVGNFAVTQTYTGITNVTFPTTGTLATTSQLLVSPLTTKGDIWVWSTTNDRLPVGATSGQILQVNSVAATGLSYSTPTYPSASGTAGTIIRSNGTNNIYSTSTFADTYAASNLLYSNGANTVTGLATANNGLLVTSNAGVPSILAGPGATGRILQSNAAAAPSFSTATYPSVATGTGTILRADGTNWVPSTATYPNTAGTAGNIMTSDGTNFVSSTPSVVLPTGTMFNFQSTNTTTVSTITNTATMTDITGVSVAITPTSSSNKVLVRAAVQVSVSAATGVLQLVRGSTAIGIGAAAGSRTVAGAVGFTGVQSNSLVTVVMEFLDSPATTSATTYKVQGALLGGTGSLFCNQSITDSNTATFPRTSSTISVCEVKV